MTVKPADFAKGEARHGEPVYETVDRLFAELAMWRALAAGMSAAPGTTP